MLRTLNLFTALSFGTHPPQLVQRTLGTLPRECLERPALRRFVGILWLEAANLVLSMVQVGLVIPYLLDVPTDEPSQRPVCIS